MYHQLYDSCKLIPLEDRDRELEELWAELEDVPMDPETECIEKPYLHFPAGTNREAIWAWFDCRYSKGVHHLLYGYGGVDRTDEIAKLVYLNGLCDDCGSKYCAYGRTKNTGTFGFEKLCGELLDRLASFTIWSKYPIRVPHQKSRAKYFPGDVITSIDDLLDEELVYWRDKITPRGWFLSWQLKMTKDAIDGGIIRRAVKKVEVENA